MIIAWLPKGADSIIFRAFVMMCAEKIGRPLRLFVAVLVWLCAWIWKGSLRMERGNIWQLEIVDSRVAIHPWF
jgi:hypothetical protein